MWLGPRSNESINRTKVLKRENDTEQTYRKTHRERERELLKSVDVL